MADYIGVHCLQGKKPLIEIRQVEVTYDLNLPYIGISQYTLPNLEISQYTLSYMEIHQNPRRSQWERHRRCDWSAQAKRLLMPM
jgi:hypothetical protein